MTQEEVMALSDEELQKTTATLRGCFEFEMRHEGPFEVLWGHAREGSEGNLLTGGWGKVSNYSRDIAAAWELVEIVLAQHDDWWADVQTNHSGARWDAGFGDYVGHKHYAASAETAPLAITRAFVLAMSSKT
jgi:hypothetical protein